MTRLLVLLGALALMAPAEAQTLRLSYYNDECSECGLKEVPIGQHAYCALSAVGSGGFNSSCALRHTSNGWLLQIRDSETTYEGETQGCSALCFDFAGGDVPTIPPTPPPSATAIGWGDHAMQYRGQNGQQFRFQCPAGSVSTSVWGSGPYTDDSRICVAGVHAGAITAASGGIVTIEIQPGQASYSGSTRNGVASRNYGQWSGSYVVVR